MLDDLKYIHERDAQDALGVAEKQWQQLSHKFENCELKNENCQNVVLAGMGGSALAAQIAGSWPGLSVPFEIVRGYDLPAFVGPNTLFVASSYSGNTEETLAAVDAAIRKGARIVVIAAGGKLAELAKANNYPFYELPSGYQPRMAVWFNFAALMQLFAGANLVRAEILTEVTEAAQWLSEQVGSWRPDVSTQNNQAKKLALDLVGKSVVVYAGPKLYPAAYKWKINFNENAKNIAWSGAYPEFNHNEFLGWTSHPIDKPYAVVDLRSNLENLRVQKRFKVTERLLSGRRPAPEVVEAQGDTLLKQLLWVFTLGDFVSLYLALLNGLNPTPVDLIEKFKLALNE